VNKSGICKGQLQKERKKIVVIIISKFSSFGVNKHLKAFFWGGERERGGHTRDQTQGLVHARQALYH
jgi:hypothetical protein